MAMARFFCDTDFSVRDPFELPEAVAHHIRVRRLRVGESLILFDGRGNEAYARLTQVDKHASQVQIERAQYISREISGHVTLVQGLASQDKMDWILEKATELGVTRTIAVQAQRSVVKLSGERANRRKTHSERIIESASEQCGRNHLMQVLMPLSLEDAINLCQDRPMLVCLPTEEAKPLNDAHLLELIFQNQGCAIFIGPEGGWSPQECEQLLRAGAISTSLGARVLRTETAGLASVSALTALLNWDQQRCETPDL